MRYPKAKASGLPKDSVYEIAESVRKQLGYDVGGDIKQAVSRIGGRVAIASTSSDENSGSIDIHGVDNFDIFLASDTGRTRDRFTIAHELGHYVLHFLWRRRTEPALQNLSAERYDSTRAEWEANWFAAAFLMPKKEFIAAFNSCNENLSAVADQFGVSTKAAEIRAQALNLIN
jgi:Zn-dependent peptidase ImmA (M78 family)